MACSRSMRLCLITIVALSNFILLACAGIPDIPDSEKKYAEGTVVEGGVYGFRMKVGSGEVMRFIVRDHVAFEPEDFHAYYGDKVGVTYYTKIKRGAPRHEALALKHLEASPERIDFDAGSVDGIVRAAGLMRYLVHLPEMELTVAFYTRGDVILSPGFWTPKPGNRVRVYYSIEANRFHKRFICTQMHRLEKERVAIQDTTESGIISKFLLHRNIRMIPDRFIFQIEGKDPLRIYTGGETLVSPEDTRLNLGTECTIQYYALLLGDQSRRLVARSITWQSNSDDK